MVKIKLVIKYLIINIRKALNILVALNRGAIADIYIKGAGIEIGALHSPLPVPKQAKVKYVDRMSVADLRKHYPEKKTSNLVAVDIVDNGETLAMLANDSQDFVIANHFL